MGKNKISGFLCFAAKIYLFSFKPVGFLPLRLNEFCLCFLLCFVFGFSGLHLWHMEVPRLGVDVELELPAYATATAMQIHTECATYTTAHGNAGSLTH